MVFVVGEGRLSKKDIRKIRLSFWLLWSFCITAPGVLAVYLLHGSWWVSPVVTTLSTVIGYNYGEWLLKRRQWRSVHTVVLCECGHENMEHKDDRTCLHSGLGGHGGTLRRDCVCFEYTPRFWLMLNHT